MVGGSDRAKDVLAYIERAMNPDAPLSVDLADRRLDVTQERKVRGQLLYLRLRLRELALSEEILVSILRLKERM